MSALLALTRRNCKLFFKDKGMFFTSLVTPVILLVLYVGFLGNVFRSTFTSAVPMELPEKLLNALVAGELISSLFAVSCVTVSFCVNLQMVMDKVTGVRRDLTVSPIRSSTLALSYYLSTLLTAMLVCLAALAVCLLYLAATGGWYLSFSDILLLLLDIFLLVMFGTAFSSILHRFLHTQGQMSAVSTIVSAGYGFLCGAYMPISQFSPGLQKLFSFLPGTYGTVLARNHALRGAFDALRELGVPQGPIQSLRDAVDCNLYFFGTRVSTAAMYAILCGTTFALIAVYLLLTFRKKSR